MTLQDTLLQILTYFIKDELTHTQYGDRLKIQGQNKAKNQKAIKKS